MGSEMCIRDRLKIHSTPIIIKPMTGPGALVLEKVSIIQTPRLISNIEHRCFRKCEVRLVEKGQKQEGGHQSNEEEGHHPE